MGTSLAGNKIKNSYLDLLQIGNTRVGLDATLRPVCDGDGTASGAYLSTATDRIGIGGLDCLLIRDAANTLAMFNGTNAQLFRPYNTWSGAGADTEFGEIGWASNKLVLRTNGTGTGVSNRGLQLGTGGTSYWEVDSSGHLTALSNDVALKLGASGDVILARDAANILAQRNGTAAQAQRWYNTTDGAGNAEYLELTCSSNIFHARVQKTGTGTVRTLRLGSDDNLIAIAPTIIGLYVGGYYLVCGANDYLGFWNIDTQGHLTAGTDNTKDIGLATDHRPRTLYLGTSLVLGTSASDGAITAVAGNSRALTITGPAAVSGNTAGGDVAVVGGAPFGSGAGGRCLLRPSSGTGIRVVANASGYSEVQSEHGTLLLGSNATTVQIGNGNHVLTTANLLRMGSSGQYSWCSDADPALAASDVGLARTAAKVVKLTDGSSGAGWLQNSAARSRLVSAVTNVTTTLANLTELSLTLIAGRKYTGRLVLIVNNALAVDGFKLDMNGGAATITSIEFGFSAAIGSTVGVRTSTALATAITITALPDTSDIVLEIPITVVCDAGGTLIPKQAKVADAAGATLTIRAGSYFWLEDMVA